MAEHLSTWDRDDDDWVLIFCSCGWGREAAYPSEEEAGDAWGDHMYEVAATQRPTAPAPGRPPSEQWWTINGEVMLDVMHRCAQGEDPEMVYLELIANSTAEEPTDG